MSTTSYPIGLNNVAIYLRKSRADLEAEARGEGETLAKHRKALLELARKYRYTVRDVYEEIVTGESIAIRPEIQRLLKAVEEGKYEAVLTMDMDRLGRGDQIDQGIIASTFKYSNTLIITPRKVYNLQDELDEEWSEFEQFLARREYKIIARRLARGRRMAAKEGKCVGRIPYGYMRTKDLRLLPDPETAPVVKKIFELRAEGMGRFRIAHWLDDHGIAPPSGKGQSAKWESVTIRDILHNETYLGRIVFGQYKYVKTPSGRKKKIPVPRDQWIIVENAHPAIIDQELWERAHAMDDILSTRNTKNRGLKNALAGLIRCGQCGKMMIRRPHYGRKKSMLICTTHRCNTRSARYEDVEARLLAQLETLSRVLPKHDHRRLATTDSDNIDLLQRNIKAIRDEIANLEKQRENLHDLLEQGIYTVDVFLERNQRIGERLDDANRRLTEVQTELEEEKRLRNEKEKLVPAIAKVIEEYKQARDVDIRNKLLKSVLREVRYHRLKEWPMDKPFELELVLRV